MWPEETPFHTPVFVVTHQKRNPWERPGGTTFSFVNDGLESALSPVLFGSGIRLFEGVDAGRVALQQVRAEPTQRVTHLTYAVRQR